MDDKKPHKNPLRNLDEDVFVITSAGRDVPWKGFDGLRRVVKRHEHWKLNILSGASREELHATMQASDVFVLNAEYEGLPHILIECMMLCVPIIATKVGGIPELLTDRVSALLIEPKNDEALYNALRDIEEHPHMATARAVNAWKFIEGIDVPGTNTEEDIARQVENARFVEKLLAES